MLLDDLESLLRSDRPSCLRFNETGEDLEEPFRREITSDSLAEKSVREPERTLYQRNVISEVSEEVLQC